MSEGFALTHGQQSACVGSAKLDGSATLLPKSYSIMGKSLKDRIYCEFFKVSPNMILDYNYLSHSSLYTNFGASDAKSHMDILKIVWIPSRKNYNAPYTHHAFIRTSL